jgi:tetratricopeptide (TPR) repeat protein
MTSEAITDFERGKSLYKAKNYKEAIAALRRASESEPGRAECHAWLADAYRGDDQFDEAIQSATRAIQLDPTCALGYLVRGGALRRQQKTEAAIPDLTEAIRLDPKSERGHRALGHELYNKQAWPDAMKEYTQALSLMKQDQDDWRKECLNRRGWCGVRLGSQYFDAALRDFAQALEIDATMDDPHVGRGNIYIARKQWQDAIREYTEALRLEPADTTVTRARYYWRSQAYSAIGDKEHALMDTARSRTADEWPVCSGSKHNFDPWYKRLNDYFGSDMVPKLKGVGERLVTYGPAYLLWGKETTYRQDVTGKPRVYSFENGTFGTSALIITDRQVYLLALAALTKQFPFIKRGVSDFLLGSLVGAFDSTQPTKQDLLWNIPHRDILGAQVVDNGQGNRRLRLVTAAMQWEIYEHFTDDLDEFSAGLNLARSGKLEHLFDKPAPVQAKPVAQVPDAVVQLLQKLGDLKTAGILSDAEFEAKKAELLSRL